MQHVFPEWLNHYNFNKSQTFELQILKTVLQIVVNELKNICVGS